MEYVEKDIYPWLAQSFQYLVRLQEINRLPHAILCTGQEGLGLETLALNSVQYFLCHNKNSCGKCTSCTLFKVGNHPDFLWVKSEDNKTISVDEIRHLIDFVAQTPTQSQNKMVLISEAERLNPSSSNALLKVLEEPPPSSKIMLITSSPYRLPATIKSRCHFLKVSTPSKEISLPWLIQKTALSKKACTEALSFTQERPLQALVWLEEDKLSQKNQFIEGLFEVSMGQKNPIGFSDLLAKKSFPEIIDWLYLLVLDMVRLWLMDQPELFHHDQLELVRKLKDHTTGDVSALMAYLDRIVQQKRQFQEGVRFNLLLWWDRIITEWCCLSG